MAITDSTALDNIGGATGSERSRRGFLRRTLAASVAMPAAAVASACGPLGKRAQEASPAAKELKRGIKLGVMVKGGFYTEHQDAAVIQPALAQWQTRTGITVDPIDVGESPFNEKLQVLLAAGTPPDLVSIGYSQDPFGILLRVGALAPLDPLMKRDKLDAADYYPYALEHFRVKGTQWGLPQSTNPTLMFHNRDLLTRAGLQPPHASWKAPGFTWGDLTTMAQAMTTRGEDPAKNVFGTGVADGIKTPAVAIWSYGGDLFDKDHTKSTMDSPQAVDGLQMLADLIHKHRVHPSPEQMKGTNARTMFRTGRIGLLGWGQALEFVDRVKQDKPAFPWGINVFPRGNAGRFSVTIGWALSLLKASRYPDEAWELTKHAGGRDFLRLVAREGRGGISPLKSVMAEVLASPDLPPGFKEAVDMTTELRRYPVLAQWNEISDLIIKQLNRVWQGSASVRQVTSDIVTEVNPLLKDRV
ncbi:MAG: sugar ABC transporter substrate-binding protein [Chloroflexi bacterium]|nr:sugar ABC transporter substrate-binding protein [Chloroflexota bacterium]